MKETCSKRKEAAAAAKKGPIYWGLQSSRSSPNVRLKCVKTGHEMVVKDKDSYAQNKRCRLGLVDIAFSYSMPPLNLFKQVIVPLNFIVFPSPEAVVEEGGKESEEISTRTKRMSIEIGPSSFASTKKKSRKNTRS